MTAPAEAEAPVVQPNGLLGVDLEPPAQLLAPVPAATPILRRLDVAAKRALDIALSLLLLALLVPFVIVIALAIKLDSRGPTLFRCERVGHRGRKLMMLKFRKMRDGVAGVPLTLDHDPRFTRIGAWLARLKLDEIPQLWHVLRGEMSLVGPRPETARFVNCYPHEYERIVEARPGIVGLSQVAYVDESRLLDHVDPVRHYIDEILPQKVEMDLLYVGRRNLWLDLRILFWGLLAVLLRVRISVDRSTGRMSLARGQRG